MSGDETSAFRKGFSKGRDQGYLQALNDILKKEESVILMVDDTTSEPSFQTQTLIVESKHIRILLDAIKRNKVMDN